MCICRVRLHGTSTKHFLGGSGESRTLQQKLSEAVAQNMFCVSMAALSSWVGHVCRSAWCGRYRSEVVHLSLGVMRSTPLVEDMDAHRFLSDYWGSSKLFLDITTSAIVRCFPPRNTEVPRQELRLFVPGGQRQIS